MTTGENFTVATIYDLHINGGKVRVCDGEVEGLIEIQTYSPNDKNPEAVLVLPTEVVEALIPLLQRKIRDLRGEKLPANIREMVSR